MGLGGIIFGYTGAFVRFIFGTIWRTILKKKKFSLIEYINCPLDTEDEFFDTHGTTLINKVVGIIFIVIICTLLMTL